MPAIRSFQEVLDAAISDMTENGFDSVERVERWTRELRSAAERSTITAASVEQTLRDALAAIYRKMVDRGGIVRFHPGVERFTIERVRPALRAELDRRIMASANLIKLNRAEAIEKTLRRFQGWSTSIPPGGVPAETRAETKKTQRKALAQLPFEERRVLIDQGHKLTSSLNDILARDGGAIAARWRSHWRQAGYNYREDHKDRDEKVYLVRESWARSAGLVKPGKAGYTDDVTAPGQEPFCRCYYVYLYNLRDLPAELLTAKGRGALSGARGQEEVRSARYARADAVVETSQPTDLEIALRRDLVGYAKGIRRYRNIPDKDQWHAAYVQETRTVELQEKFRRLSQFERVHVLLHEIAHRGQDSDARAFERFKRAHLNRMESFAEMANPVHLRDLARLGKIDSLASEVWAESYARYMLGLDLPSDLKAFWDERRAGGLMTKTTAEYFPTWAGHTRCMRCEMFRLGANPAAEGLCEAVAGPISPHGHCKLFEAIGTPRVAA